MDSLHHLMHHNFLPLSCLSGLFSSKALEAETLYYFPSVLQFLLLVLFAVLGIMTTLLRGAVTSVCTEIVYIIYCYTQWRCEECALLFIILRQLIH